METFVHYMIIVCVVLFGITACFQMFSEVL